MLQNAAKNYKNLQIYCKWSFTSSEPNEITLGRLVEISVMYLKSIKYKANKQQFIGYLAQDLEAVGCKVFHATADSGVLVYHFVSDRNVTRVQPGDNNFMDKTASTGSNIFSVRFARAKNCSDTFLLFLRTVSRERE